MVLKSKERYIYTPKFDGNDELPPSERVTAEIIRPSTDEIDELSDLELVRDLSKKQVADMKTEKGKTADDRPQKASVRFIRRQDTSRILREHVGRITNLVEEVQDEKGKVTRRAINSGADLADSKAFGIRGLVDELCAVVLDDKIEEETEKNSESAPSST